MSWPPLFSLPFLSSSSLYLFSLSFSFSCVFFGLIWSQKRISYTFLGNYVMIQKLFTFLISFRLGGCNFRKIRFWNIRLGDVTRDDSQRRFFCAIQRSNVGTRLQPFGTVSQQCWNDLKIVKNRRCKSSRVITFAWLIVLLGAMFDGNSG